MLFDQDFNMKHILKRKSNFKISLLFSLPKLKGIKQVKASDRKPKGIKKGASDQGKKGTLDKEERRVVCPARFVHGLTRVVA